MSKTTTENRNQTMLVSAPVSMQEVVENLIEKLGLHVTNSQQMKSLTDDSYVTYWAFPCDGIHPEQLSLPGIKVNRA